MVLSPFVHVGLRLRGCAAFGGTGGREGKKGRASLEKDRETWRENTYLGGHFGRYWELFDKKKGSGSSRDREKRG